MQDWDKYQSEQEAEKRARLEQLWYELAEESPAPERELLTALSGLLGEDVAALQQRWDNLRLEARRALVQDCGQLADEDFKLDFSALFRIGLRDDDDGIRASSTLGLREVEDVRLIPTLAEMLRQDPSASARAAAATALGDYVLLGELGKTRREPFEVALTALKAAYLDPAEEPEVQRQAIESVAYTGEGEVPELIRDAYEVPDEGMQISAVFAMGRSADARWGKIIRQELTNTNPTMRLQATRAAGELQLREAADDVASRTDDVDQSVRLMALWALGQIGGPVARKILSEFTTSDDAEMQAAAQEALQELEFFQGDSASFFGPPAEFSGDAEEPWALTDLLMEDLDEDAEGPDDQ